VGKAKKSIRGELRPVVEWHDELGLPRLRTDLINGNLVARGYDPLGGEWLQIPQAHWQQERAVERAVGGCGWPIGGGLFSPDVPFRLCAIYAARPGPSKEPKEPRQGNKRVQKEVIRRIHEKYPSGVPGGTSVAAVRRKISDKNPDGFRPGWDVVKEALVALGYVLPKK